MTMNDVDDQDREGTVSARSEPILRAPQSRTEETE